MTVSFLLNGNECGTSLPPGAVALDLIRDDAQLTGTRDGCREGDCGACTVLLGTPGPDGVRYSAVNSCILPVGELPGRHLVTIEGVSPEEGLSAVQEPFVEHGASQCGFCTPGMVMSLTGYLLSTTKPDFSGAVRSLEGNICRCTGYISVRRAAAAAVNSTGPSPAGSPFSREHLEHLISRNVIPGYFLDIEKILAEPREPERSDGAGTAVCLKVAGGTDLFVTGGEEPVRRNLRFLSREPQLRYVREQGRGLFRIGAASTVEDLIESGIFKGTGNLHDSLRLISSAQVRSRATVGGNIVNASPIGDLTIILLALEAVLRISGDSGFREIPLRDFFRGYKVIDLHPDELLESVCFSRPGSEGMVNFEKVSMRKHLDIASVNTAAAFRVTDRTVKKAVISAGGVAPVPAVLNSTCEYLRNRDVSPGTVLDACRTAMEEISPITDVRGTAEYKRLLTGRLLKAHFLELFPEMLEPGDIL